MDNLEQLLQQALQECERLRNENQQLKKLLIQHNQQAFTNSPIHNTTLKNAISKNQKINERIDLFKDLFNGRTDVYAVRWQSKNGRSGYSPACSHE